MFIWRMKIGLIREWCDARERFFFVSEQEEEKKLSFTMKLSWDMWVSVKKEKEKFIKLKKWLSRRHHHHHHHLPISDEVEINKVIFIKKNIKYWVEKTYRGASINKASNNSSSVFVHWTRHITSLIVFPLLVLSLTHSHSLHTKKIKLKCVAFDDGIFFFLFAYFPLTSRHLSKIKYSSKKIPIEMNFS